MSATTPEAGLLYRRLTQDGTISEPDGKPDPQFALPSAVNWMRALRILSHDRGLDFERAARFYSAAAVQPGAMSAQNENTVLEQLFLALHHLSALKTLAATGQDTEFGRVGVITWYYGLANAAAAMTAAQAGTYHETDAESHRGWDAHIASRGLAMEPFGWRVPSLLARAIADEVSAIRGTSSGNLQAQPTGPAEAIGVAAQYLKGSAAWYAREAEERLRRHRDFVARGLTDFRKKEARALRDQRLAGRSIGFMHQAYRYRGKANHREALFLAYGPQAKSILAGYLDDQQRVLSAFVGMAGAFAAARLPAALWMEFLDDADRRRAFSLSAQAVWSS